MRFFWGGLAALYRRRLAAMREAHSCVAGDAARYDVHWLRLQRNVVVHVALSQGIRILNGLGKSTSTSGPKVVETPP